jgi:hypothetical protein
MAAFADDRDIAAGLVVSVEVGLLSTKEAIRLVDREIATRSSPAAWLIAASLANTPEDLLHVLRETAESHPILDSLWPLLEAMERALDKGVDPIAVACRIKKVYPYGEWPEELSQLLYDVYEEATCAHEHEGEPQPRLVENALRALFAEAKRHGSWCSVLDGLRLEGSAAEQ